MSKLTNKLITLEPKGKIIFIGDTHGDISATKFVIKNYQKDNNILIFLGDYVDRGNYSKENVNLIIKNYKVLMEIHREESLPLILYLYVLCIFLIVQNLLFSVQNQVLYLQIKRFQVSNLYEQYYLYAYGSLPK